MSVYSFKYKVLNRETGRKVSVTRWRVQIRKGGENINKVFDDESTARSYEEQELKGFVAQSQSAELVASRHE